MSKVKMVAHGKQMKEQKERDQAMQDILRRKQEMEAEIKRQEIEAERRRQEREAERREIEAE